MRSESAPTVVRADLTRLDLDLSPGLHTIKVTKPGYADFEEQINVQDDDTLFVVLTKSTTTPTASHSGSKVVWCATANWASKYTERVCKSVGGKSYSSEYLAKAEH